MSKMRMTRQRRIILDELRRTKSHPTASDIYQKVRRKLPHISLGTVYRNLNVLEESGEIIKLTNCGDQTRFDGDVSNHFHLRCMGCGSVIDIEKKHFDDIDHYITSEKRVEIQCYHLEFIGFCHDCSEEGRTTGDIRYSNDRRDQHFCS